MNTDLHTYKIKTDGYPKNQTDYSVRVSDCDLEVVFHL